MVSVNIISRKVIHNDNEQTKKCILQNKGNYFPVLLILILTGKESKYTI